VLRTEVGAAYALVRDELSLSALNLPAFVLQIPWLGDQLQAIIERLSSDRDALRAEILQWIDPWIGKVGVLAGGVGHFVANMGFALLTVFFFYRDGARLAEQARQILR